MRVYSYMLSNLEDGAMDYYEHPPTHKNFFQEEIK